MSAEETRHGGRLPDVPSASGAPERSGTTGQAENLAPLVRRPAYDAFLPWLREVFTGPLFDVSGDVGEGRHALTHRRLRHVNDHLGRDAELWRHRDRLFAVLEWAVLADPPLFYALFIHHCQTVGLIRSLSRGDGGPEDELRNLVSGRAVGALLTTEPGHGNSNNAIRTEAVYDPVRHEFVLRTPGPAAAKFSSTVAGPGVPQTAVVSARLVAGGRDRGLGFFAVPISDGHGPRAGVRITPRPLAAALPTAGGTVVFDGVRVPFRNWLRDGASLFAEQEDDDPPAPSASPADRLRMATVILPAWEAATVALAAVARASTAIAVRHAHRHRTTGRHAAGLPLIAHRNQQLVLFASLAGAYILSFVARTMTAPAQPEPTAGGLRTAYLLKIAATRLAERIVMRTRTACGVHGFLEENRFLSYQVLVHSFHSTAADSQVMLLEAAHSLVQGADYTPPAPPPPGGTSRDLSDPDTWTRLAEARERALHRELTTALREAEESGRSAFDAWNDHIDLAQELAEAHTATTLLALVRRQLDSPECEDVRALLRDLCGLYVLEELGEHAGRYLTEGLLLPDEVRGLRERVHRICARLAPHALDLVEGLRVPHEVVRAPAVSVRPDAHSDARAEAGGDAPEDAPGQDLPDPAGPPGAGHPAPPPSGTTTAPTPT
ncbi:acyl-CoA dehydrogenase [Streptomyces sp. DH37]|uniref:acyl-CoA dehydrogenase n=1 Tax=Streptomyces sp. DH37 TaxID=3040122 RepID=UPI002440F7D2|nr:acyl-CoA dehydrogenase [Streptomyces sp. DH37]MDG9706148.1 acyl-CoA dehydrogenase [Streptomyces sp. DH37]